MEIGWMALPLLALAVLGWIGTLLWHRRRLREAERGAREAEARSQDERVRRERTLTELEILQSRQSESEGVVETLRREAGELSRELATEKQRNEDLQARLAEEKRALEQWGERFRHEFQALSQQILKEQSTRFSEQNREQLGQMLDPLRERIVEFRRSVTDIYEKGLKEHAELKAGVAQIQQLNQVMAEDARNLTLALKGENKVQGNWGEVILERLLELSGLEKGREFETQGTLVDEESGRRLRPDVIIHLPENRNIVLDSKVSLTAFEKYCSADTEEARAVALREHLFSLRAHIKSLAAKDYPAQTGLNAPDFTLLFIPIEPAFNLALREDLGLFDDAFERKIVMVTPSTLLASLKTVASIWRQEKQNRNAEEIARLGGRLYDKIANFCESLEEVGQRLQQAQQAYATARSRLSEGHGNVLRTTERLRDLGAKVSKTLPESEELAEEDRST
jgi:DNA recombination protein RmuC